MAQIEILIISVLRVVIEVAGYSLIGQGILALLAGAGREQNIFYRILKTITRPVIRLTRAITPRFIIDTHIPFVAFFLLFWLWIGLAVLKRFVCVTNGLQC
jgi:uncharacterized protein YggT (Ycf19 family)